MSNPDEVDFEGDLSSQIAQAVPDVVPPVTETSKVGMSLRLSPAVFQELLGRAAERGIGHTVLAAELITAGLVGMREPTAMVALADVQRVLAQLAQQATPPAA